LGWNNPAYQAYRSTVDEGELVLGFFSWNTSQQEDTKSNSPLEVDEDVLSQVISVGVVAFGGLTALILGVAFLVNKRKASATKKEYGGVNPNFSSNASKEALEGRGGLSAAGGIISDEQWDDDVAQLDFEVKDDGFGDMALKSGEAKEEAASITYQEESIEAIAGMPAMSTPQEEEAPAESQMPDEAPPLPEEGLPDGWTMDQWRWYGHEWLAKYGKN
jgi:hypothetical protein